jgi:hypothetical protein
VIRLQDGYTTVDTSVEPDGRIRMTVAVDGEVVASPTFAPTDYSQVTFAVNGAILMLADRKAATV